VESFFVTFFTDKESKGGNPCSFQERKKDIHTILAIINLFSYTVCN